MKTTVIITASHLLLASSFGFAAKIPQADEKLVAQATHFVRGKVLEVTTKVEKSNIEASPSVHKDTISTITVEVDGVSKGAVEINEGKITALASQPHSRGLPAHRPTRSFRRKGRTPRST